MVLGYAAKLYLLAFDHRDAFAELFGARDTATPQEQARIEDGKSLIFDGAVIAAEAGEDPSLLGVLVDEQYGSQIPAAARRHGLKLAMPAERSGEAVFDFAYGDDFALHIERCDPDFTKVLVRYNPDTPGPGNATQLARLARLSGWLHAHDRRFLFELLVPPEDHQLRQVGGDLERYDRELRPALMRRAIAECQKAGVEVDIWKIEGIDSHAECVEVAEQTRAGGRDGVACVVLGRGADDSRVDGWLRAAAPVPGFIGFAIGRSIWLQPLTDYIGGALPRADAAAKVAENYLRFIKVYRAAQ